MELMKAIMGRRSVRQYDAIKTITDEDLKTILTAAMYAPSAMNKRPWEFVVIRDEQTLEQIREIHPYAGFITEAGTAVAVCGNRAEAYSNYAPIDVALATQNLMLAAHNLGYGTCYCGTYSDEPWVKQIAQWLNLPESVEMYGLIVVGTPLKNKEVPERFEENKIHYNVW